MFVWLFRMTLPIISPNPIAEIDLIDFIRFYFFSIIWSLIHKTSKSDLSKTSSAVSTICAPDFINSLLEIPLPAPASDWINILWLCCFKSSTPKGRWIVHPWSAATACWWARTTESFTWCHSTRGKRSGNLRQGMPWPPHRLWQAEKWSLGARTVLSIVLALINNQPIVNLHNPPSFAAHFCELIEALFTW